MGADIWTADAIEALRQLALEGRSASAIAAALGAPSRNAVIGKANRIGIKLTGGNWKHSAPGTARAGVDRPRRAAFPRSMPISCQRSPAPPLPRERVRKATWIFAEAQVGEMRRIGLEAICERDCRWPLGDPAEEDFAYCGLEAAKGQSYCAGHCRMAYRTPNARAAREGRHWMRWSLQQLPELAKRTTSERFPGD
jgi:GcrA cell cycle regulator